MTWQDKSVGHISGMKLSYYHYNSVSITWKHLKCVGVFSFHNYHSKIRELSDGNKNWKQIQTTSSAVGPTSFELWVMKTEWWWWKTTNPNNPSLSRSKKNCLKVNFLKLLSYASNHLLPLSLAMSLLIHFEYYSSLKNI